VSKAFLDHRQRFVVIFTFGIEQPIRRKSGLGEGRGEQITALNHPQHISTKPSSDSGGEQGRGGIVVKRAVRSRHFMKRRNRKAAAQLRIDRIDSEREPLGRTR
jgi:hypothetical protein